MRVGLTFGELGSEFRSMPRPVLRTVFVVALSLSGSLFLATSSISRAAETELRVATFAGGCFWCVESDFDNVPGVARTISGYTGGLLMNPTYKQVSAGGSGHREAVQIFYDPEEVTYAVLLEVFWRSVDPTDNGGQFCDRGESYKTAIYANSPEQKRLAEESKRKLEQSGLLVQPIVTPVQAAGPFYPAEEYHQDYYKKNPLSYGFYRWRCGRDARVKDLWGEDAHRGIATH
jgi:peptide-methionine (S)-S-oxide reductase